MRGRDVGALVIIPENGDWTEADGPIGTVFPISRPLRLYLGARHTVVSPPRRMGILIFDGDDLVRANVEEVGDFPGQPDVAVFRADHGVHPDFGLLVGREAIFNDARALGYPEDAVVVRRQNEKALAIRGLRGSITRMLDVGDVPKARGPSIELSFPIPLGMSGGPVWTVSPGVTSPDGLVGVCLGSLESSSVLWNDEISVYPDGSTRIEKGMRVVEYGIAAALLPVSRAPIDLAGGKTLFDLLGEGPFASVYRAMGVGGQESTG